LTDLGFRPGVAEAFALLWLLNMELISCPKCL